MEKRYQFLKKLKVELPYGPATPLLGMHPKEMKSVFQRNKCPLMFVSVLIAIAKIQKRFNNLCGSYSTENNVDLPRL